MIVDITDNKRHPNEMASAEIEAFLTHLAVDQQVAASTQNQTLSALLFLYRDVLKSSLDLHIDAIRAKRPKRLPTVLTKEETLKAIERLSGTQRLMAKLLYGGGLRLMECLRLRVKDLDFAQRQIIVRDGKGMEDRVTMLPESLIIPLQEHVAHVKRIHAQDVAPKGWPGLCTMCAGAQVSARRPALDLAICLPLRPGVERPAHRDHPASSCA
jgi:site-specific recombinase XerD